MGYYPSSASFLQSRYYKNKQSYDGPLQTTNNEITGLTPQEDLHITVSEEIEYKVASFEDSINLDQWTGTVNIGQYYSDSFSFNDNEGTIFGMHCNDSTFDTTITESGITRLNPNAYTTVSPVGFSTNNNHTSALLLSVISLYYYYVNREIMILSDSIYNNAMNISNLETLVNVTYPTDNPDYIILNNVALGRGYYSFDYSNIGLVGIGPLGVGVQPVKVVNNVTHGFILPSPEYSYDPQIDTVSNESIATYESSAYINSLYPSISALDGDIKIEISKTTNIQLNGELSCYLAIYKMGSSGDFIYSGKGFLAGIDSDFVPILANDGTYWFIKPIFNRFNTIFNFQLISTEYLALINNDLTKEEIDYTIWMNLFFGETPHYRGTPRPPVLPTDPSKPVGYPDYSDGSIMNIPNEGGGGSLTSVVQKDPGTNSSMADALKSMGYVTLYEVLSTGTNNLYAITRYLNWCMEQLKNLESNLLAPYYEMAIRNIQDSVISITAFPFNVLNYKTPISLSQFVVGGINIQTPEGADIPMITFPGSMINFTVSLPIIQQFYGNFLDFTDTSAKIFIPYCGEFEYPIIMAYNKECSLDFRIDLMTGNMLVLLIIDGVVWGSYNGNCASQISLTNVNDTSAANTVANNIRTIGSGITSAIPHPIAGALTRADAVWPQSTTSIPSVLTIGEKTMGSGGLLGPQKVYITVDRPVANKLSAQDEAFEKYKGRTSHKAANISNIHGFTVIDSIQLKCSGTTEERDELIQLLKEGVILP